MAQHDMVIDNGPGLAVRTDINAALAALVSSSSGTVEPATTVAGQLWFNTTTGELQVRNNANTAWQGLTGELGGDVTIDPAKNYVQFNGTSINEAIPLIRVRDDRSTTGATGNVVFSIARQNSNTDCLNFGNDANNAALIGGNNAPMRFGNWLSGVFTDRMILHTTANGLLEIIGGSPAVKFTDNTAAAYDYWVYVNSNVFYVLADRNDDGAWETPHPLELQAANNSGWLFGSQIYTTANLNASTASTGNTIAQRDSSGDIHVRLIRSEYAATGSGIACFMTQSAIGGVGTNNYIRPSTPAEAAAALNATGLIAPPIYTGDVLNHTSFPIGHIVSAANLINRNASAPVYINTSNNIGYITTASGAQLSGTWRGRGNPGSGTTIMQRTA